MAMSIESLCRWSPSASIILRVSFPNPGWFSLLTYKPRVQVGYRRYVGEGLNWFHVAKVLMAILGIFAGEFRTQQLERNLKQIVAYIIELQGFSSMPLLVNFACGISVCCCS